MTPAKSRRAKIFRKSSRSQGSGNNCVEVGLGDMVEVRDSKAPRLGTLAMSRAEWAALLNSAKI